MRSSLLVLLAALFCLSAIAETFHLWPHSEIINPMGIFAIPIGSNDSWSSTSTTVSKKDAKTNIYLTYEYSISNIMPPFTDSEYAAALTQTDFLIKKRDHPIARVEDSTKMRTINGAAQSTTCAVYDPKGKLFAYCTAGPNPNAFILESVSKTRLAQLKRNNNRWEVVIENSGKDNINKTVTLMLSALRIWRSRLL